MPHQLSPHETALVFICTQNMSLAAAPHSWDSVITHSKDTTSLFRSVGAPIIFVDITSSTSRRDASSATSHAPKSNLPAAFQKLIQPSDILITQRQWSTFYSTSLEQLDTWGAFHGTDLGLHLDSRKLSTIVFGGTAANGQLKATAKAAKIPGRRIIFAEDLITDFDNAQNHDNFSQHLSDIGIITLSPELQFSKI